MKKSYSDGAIESALMDAECARADLETLRNDVWQKIKPMNHNKSDFFHSVFHVLRCVSISVIVILFSVVPLAKDTLPVQSVSDEINASVLPEPEPVVITRENEKHEVRTADTKTESSSTTSSSSKRQARRQATQKKQDKPSVNTRTVTANKASQKTVPYDKVFSLVQTGQRALKENTSVINIKK